MRGKAAFVAGIAVRFVIGARDGPNGTRRSAPRLMASGPTHECQESMGLLGKKRPRQGPSLGSRRAEPLHVQTPRSRRDHHRAGEAVITADAEADIREPIVKLTPRLAWRGHT